MSSFFLILTFLPPSFFLPALLALMSTWYCWRLSSDSLAKGRVSSGRASTLDRQPFNV